MSPDRHRWVLEGRGCAQMSGAACGAPVVRLASRTRASLRLAAAIPRRPGDLTAERAARDNWRVRTEATFARIIMQVKGVRYHSTCWVCPLWDDRYGTNTSLERGDVRVGCAEVTEACLAVGSSSNKRTKLALYPVNGSSSDSGVGALLTSDVSGARSKRTHAPRLQNIRDNVPEAGEEYLWNITRLSAHMGLSESGIRRLVRRGVIPAVRVGRRILFRPMSIERFIEERETGGDIPAARGRATSLLRQRGPRSPMISGRGST